MEGIVDDLKQDISDMQKDPNTSDTEYAGKIEEAMGKLDEIIQSEQNKNDQTAEDLESSTEENTGSSEMDEQLKEQMGNISDAIQNGNKQEISDAFDDLKDWMEGLDDKDKAEAYDKVGDIFNDTANKQEQNGNQEMSDAFKDAANEMWEASDKAEGGQFDEAKDQANGAIDDLKEQVGNQSQQNQANKDAASDMSDIMQETQDSIMGVEPSDKNQQGNQPSDKEPTDEEQEGQQGQGQQPPKEPEQNENQEGNNDGGGSSAIEETIFYPGAGNVTLKELVDKGIINEQYEQMFSRGQLTEEQYNAIKQYIAQLGANNQE